VVASALHDPAAVARSSAPIVAALTSLGVRARADDPTGAAPGVVVVATGGTEAAVLDRWRAGAAVTPRRPLLLVAHGDDNSLPAALEALARIHQDGGRGRIVMVHDRDRLEAAVADLVAFEQLRAARIGVVGAPSDWLVASTIAAEAIRERWGPTLVALPTDDLVGAGRTAPDAVAVTLGRRWAAADRSASPMAEAEVVRAATIHAALARQLAEQSLDAVTVRCFDLLAPPHTSGCIALAELNESGVVAGCEGDLASTVAMLWIRVLLDRTTWMANPARVDEAAGEIVLAHCTVAPSLVDGYRLDTHFESGLGVGVAGRFRPQPVTLVRLGGRQLEQAWIVDGEIVASGDDRHLCRTQAAVHVEPAMAAALLRHPLGNHVVLVPGDHARRLREWWQVVAADGPE
jgi:L-fucose isomerase-like protein